MYFYSLIKHVGFDFERTLRMKLFCTCKNSKLNYKENVGAWWWLYGFDSQTLSNFINGDFSRDKVKELEIATYFQPKENTSIYEIKDKFKNRFNDLIVSKMGKKSTVSFIEEIYQIEIEIADFAEILY